MSIELACCPLEILLRRPKRGITVSPKKLSMGLFTKSDHIFRPGCFHGLFYARYERIGSIKMSIELACGPFEILLRRPKGDITVSPKKTEYGAIH